MNYITVAKAGLSSGYYKRAEITMSPRLGHWFTIAEFHHPVMGRVPAYRLYKHGAGRMVRISRRVYLRLLAWYSAKG